MDTLANYFHNIPPQHRTLLLAGGIACFWLLETAAPVFRWRYQKWRHAGVNLFFTFTTVLVNFSMAFLLALASEWTDLYQFGLLHWLPPMPVWLQMLFGVLMLDLVGAYLIHLIQHKTRWMWQFHVVHHADPYIDVTTANRHHPVESAFRFSFTCLAVLVTGAPWWIIMFYQSLSLLFAQFTHANLRIPVWLETALSWVLVTPTMHRVHHHFVQPQTDSNYGNIFSIWDRLFSTFMVMDNAKIHFGIDTYPKEEENSRIGQLLKIPFGEYRKPAGKFDA